MANINNELKNSTFKQPLELPQGEIDRIKRMADRASAVLNIIEKGREGGLIKISGKEYIGNLDYSISIPEIGIRPELIENLKHAGREFYEENSNEILNPLNRFGYDQKYEAFTNFLDARKLDKAFYKSLGSSGDIKAAINNIKRISHAGRGMFNRKYGYKDWHYLEKPKGRIDVYTIQQDGFFLDVVREMCEGIPMDDIQEEIATISVSLLQLHRLHTHGQLPEGEYMLLGAVDNKIEYVPILKRTKEERYKNLTNLGYEWGRENSFLSQSKSSRVSAGTKLLMWSDSSTD